MEIESIFMDSKWRILTELSMASLSPTELAEKIGTSIANVSMQLRLLEALDFVEMERLGNTAKGEPRKQFSLKKEFAYLILGTKSTIGKKMFKLDKESMPFFTIWLINDSIAPYVLLKLFIENEYLIRESIAIGYLGIRGDELEILILSGNPGSIQSINDKQLTRNEKTYKIKAHIHTLEMFQNGINNKEDYYVSMLKKVFIITDRDNLLSNMKKGGR
jgi:DNA-binding transcriptional ArsR family regulator